MKSGHGRGARGRRPLHLRGGLDGPGLRRLHGGHGGAYDVPINATASCLTGTLFLEDTYQRLNPSHNPRQCGAVAKGSTCSQSSFAPTKAADGWCEIKSKEVLDLLHGSAFVQMKFEQEEEGSDFSFHFIKKVCNFCCICCWGGPKVPLPATFCVCAVRPASTDSINITVRHATTTTTARRHGHLRAHLPLPERQDHRRGTLTSIHPSIHQSTHLPFQLNSPTFPTYKKR